jgi:hypothetical protein
MSEAAKRKLSPLVVQDTIGNPAFIDALERAVTAAAYRVYDEGQPVYLPGCAGTLMYLYAVDSTYKALQSTGFMVKPVQKQLRVFARDRYECPVWLRFAIGTAVGKSIIFNWPKGIATAAGVRQNQKRLETRAQLPLFGTWAEDNGIEPDLNLWVAYNISKKNLRVILGMGIELVNDHTILCDRIVEVCNKPLDLAEDADYFIAPADSDYPIEFGEKTGTE